MSTAVVAAVGEWQAAQDSGAAPPPAFTQDFYTSVLDPDTVIPLAPPHRPSPAQDYDGSEVVKPDHYVAHVAVPSQVDVEGMLVMRQRKVRRRVCVAALTGTAAAGEVRVVGAAGGRPGHQDAARPDSRAHAVICFLAPKRTWRCVCGTAEAQSWACG